MLDRKCLAHTLQRCRAVIDDQSATRLGHQHPFGAGAHKRADALSRGFAHPQFVRHHFQAHQTFDAGKQREIIDGFSQEIVGTRLKALHAVFRLIERGHHDNGNMFGRGRCLQTAADLKPVHAGHHHIKQYDVGQFAGGNFNSFRPGRRLEHTKIFGGQLGVQQLQISRNVIDNKYACRHCYVLSAKKALNGLKELRYRNGFGDICLAAPFTNFFFVALHRKGGDGHNGDGAQAVVFLDPFGDFKAGNFRQLDVHKDQVRAIFTGNLKRLDAIARLQRLISMSVQKIMEELHIQLIIFDDQYFFGHRIHAPELHLLPSPSGAL